MKRDKCINVKSYERNEILSYWEGNQVASCIPQKQAEDKRLLSERQQTGQYYGHWRKIFLVSFALPGPKQIILRRKGTGRHCTHRRFMSQLRNPEFKKSQPLNVVRWKTCSNCATDGGIAYCPGQETNMPSSLKEVTTSIFQMVCNASVLNRYSRTEGYTELQNYPQVLFPNKQDKGNHQKTMIRVPNKY